MTALAPIGHNAPPDPIDAICAAYEGTRMEAENWLDGTSAVDDEPTMVAVDRIRSEARQWRLELERGQKGATAPLYDAYKAEGARWKPTIDDAKRMESGLVSLVDGYKKKLAAQKEAERKAAWEAARAAEREAEEAARKAAADDLDAQREAAAAAEAAMAAKAAATEAQRDTVKGLRTVTRYEITSPRDLLNWLAQNRKDDVMAFLEEWSRRNHKPDPSAAGLRVWTEKEAF